MRTVLIVCACAFLCACQNYEVLGASDSGIDANHETNRCESDAECVFLPNRSCCPDPPDPCNRGREVGTLEDRDEIEKWIEENCQGVECPVYSPPECGNCLNLLDYVPKCTRAECVRQETVNCEQLCTAASKNPEEPCPFISHPELLTEENLATCGCRTCQAIDPNAFGDCSIFLGAGFDGTGCFYVQGCDCAPHCANLFDTLGECRSACNRSCTDIAVDIATFKSENSACITDADCNVVEGSFPPLFQHCSCSVYLNRDADLEAWDRINLEWILVPNDDSQPCGDPAGCCDEVPPFPACINGECGPAEYIDPDWDRYLCESTGGEWDPLSCGHYWCGREPDCDGIIPGCNCGHGRNFTEGVGCGNDVACGVAACAATPEIGLPIGRLCEEDAHCADLEGGFCQVLNLNHSDEFAFCTKSCATDDDCIPGTTCQGIHCGGGIACMPAGCCQGHVYCEAGEVCDVDRLGGMCPDGYCCDPPGGAFTCRQVCDPGSPDDCPVSAPRCEVIEILTEDYIEAFYVCLP